MTQPLPHVAVVFTGGTLSMRVDPQAGGAVPALSGADLLHLAPELGCVAEIHVTDFGRLPGPHMTPARMWELAQAVQVELARPDVQGVVVTHGTDTLEETAYLLDLLLDSPKPVVLMGAMRNSSEPGWDGPANLRSAVRVAADPAARGLGAVVVMGEQIFAAEEVTKSHTESLDAFRARDFGPLGFVDKDRVIIARRRSRREHIAAPALEERVEIVKLSAGSDGRFIRCAMETGMRGLVIEGFGRGNVPLTAIGAVEAAARGGLPIVVTSRCARGRVLDTYAYAGGGRQLTQMGVILGGLLSSQKARIKLMLLLGAGAGHADIKASFEDAAMDAP